MPDKDSSEDFGCYEAQCQGCDSVCRVDDLGLCQECAQKLDRDLIRQRDWDYAVSAFALTPSQREELRKQIIAQHGEALELIAPKGAGPPADQT